MNSIGSLGVGVGGPWRGCDAPVQKRYGDVRGEGEIHKGKERRGRRSADQRPVAGREAGARGRGELLAPAGLVLAAVYGRQRCAVRLACA